MIAIAQKKKEALKNLFAKTAQSTHFDSSIVEKDFYVVLMLEVLFNHTKFGKHFVFKGGTSLSKAYGLINRFSEDIDLVIDYRLFDLTPEEIYQERSNNQQFKFITRVNEQVQAWLESTLIPDIEETLKSLNLHGFEVVINKDTKLNIDIYYPKSYEQSAILPIIKLETSLFSEWLPCEKRSITSYVAQEESVLFKKPSCDILTVHPTRTFWDKVTILHKEANRPNDKIAPRYARHYYDLYALSNSWVKDQALNNLLLRDNVIDLKEKFYYASYANFEAIKHKQANFQLNPLKLKHLEKDYQNMYAMFMNEPPTFKEMMHTIQNLQETLNH